ncbi:DUF6279 family lipoprotein [Photobacterium sp. DNB23_23_1]|uniref:DUF6279 family lipoprotein n=1 Tax=Photobacterium pectinilyticum TaxID=2906793 RepID=A0ABT1N228_9GAMM|nr:DUF6279 family lipoprotein [Photobacterium sp. ZSDE20]MCQ1057324.1 DUF6279 family lipoprotein [Photobacterium sp. ZSDE20]MDD1821783.1 DUF6279 family lipoprotein [Photobacterium sp. ZSDE20]
MSTKIPKWAAFTLSVVMVAGCTTRLAYNNLDVWLSYRLSSYVTLNSSQDSTFDRGLDRALALHRRQELPKIHRAIDRLQADLLSPMTYGQVQEYYTVFTQLGQDSAAILAEPLADVFSQFSNTQVAQVEASLRQRFAKFDQERSKLSDSQKLAKRVDRLQDFTQDWVGSLTSRQKELLTELAGYQLEMAPIFRSMRNGYFERWQQLMKNRTQPEFKIQLTKLARDMMALNSPQYQSEIRFYLNRRFELMRRLNHTMSPSQQSYLNRKLVDLRKDVALLINQ